MHALHAHIKKHGPVRLGIYIRVLRCARTLTPDDRGIPYIQTVPV